MLNTVFDLQRFVDAQAGVYEQVLEELTQGRKMSHWMWFIFPQIHGLGQSAMAVRYAIASLGEAEAYLAHPLLGPRLFECCDLLLEIEGSTIGEIMGYPDDLKLRSSMTLFSRTTKGQSCFSQVLERYFDGAPDAATLRLLNL